MRAVISASRFGRGGGAAVVAGADGAAREGRGEQRAAEVEGEPAWNRGCPSSASDVAAPTPTTSSRTAVEAARKAPA